MHRQTYAAVFACLIFAAWMAVSPRGVMAASDETPAAVIAVDASGVSGAYRFAVTVRSPDTGCDRYADWWEVVREDGTLAHRRILAHSHVDEQPFTRTGGPIAVDGGETVIVRVHMHPDGYADRVMRGSVEAGFAAVDLEGFASDLATAPPQPDGCRF